MEPPPTSHTMTERDNDITATVVRERTRLVN
ncbi:MAG: RNA polymerase subunit sigma-24, partial [Paraburkholderia caledonica]